MKNLTCHVEASSENEVTVPQPQHIGVLHATVSRHLLHNRGGGGGGGGGRGGGGRKVQFT